MTNMWDWVVVAGALLWFLRKHVAFFLVMGYLFYLEPFFALFFRYWHCDHTRVLSNQSVWSRICTWVCRIRLLQLPNSAAVQTTPPTILLGNHRGITDFFLHDCVTNHTANFLSRALVGVLFFPLYLITWYENTVWFFVRGFVKADPELFYRWLDEQWKCGRNIRPNLLLYPEGHRNAGSQPLRLRTGMLRYAYSRKIPVQVYIVAGYDGALDERHFTVDFRLRIAPYKVDTPLDPAAYESEASFLSVVEKRFAALHTEVFQAVR